MLGYFKEFLQKNMIKLLNFLNLGKNFINVAIKKYFSCMKARLGFSIATVEETDS